MPWADFQCDACNKIVFDAAFSFIPGSEKWPECKRDGTRMRKLPVLTQNFHAGQGDFPAHYLETAPPDPLDPATPMGRWIRTKSDQKRYEKELDQSGRYIPTAAEASNRIGSRTRPTATIRDERRNIARYGPEYFDARRKEDKRKKT